MVRRKMPAVTLPLLLLLFLGIMWPGSATPYQITGEESLPGQVRGLVQWLYSALRPQPKLAADAALAYASPTPFAANTFLQLEVLPEVRQESLHRLYAAGFRAIRQEFTWEDIEVHGKGDFIDRRNEPNGVDAWAKYDNIVELAGQEGLEIIARLGNPPAWTRAAGDAAGTHAPPDNLDDFGDYVAAVVSRYRGRVRIFQLWNEPNIYPEWGEQRPDPVAFTRLLCTGYRRAKAANPQALILAPALSPTIAFSDRDMNDLVYLQQMYLAGAGDCFDIFSAQGYGLFSGPTDHRLRPTVMNFPHNLYLRDLMVRHGDAAKPIWISEMGWNAVPDGMPQPYGQVDEEQQARYEVEAFRRAQREWPWVGMMAVWFFKRPDGSEQNQPWYYFRLVEPDFTPLPVFAALSDYANSAAGQGGAVQPAGWYAWQGARPALAALVGGLFFFCLLLWLMPASPARPS